MTQTTITTQKVAESRRRRRVNVARVRRERTAWLFMAPSILIIGAFMIWPLLQSAYLSFTQYNRIQPAKWVGWRNYVELVGDEQVWNALGNTAVYAVVVTPVTVFLALLFAIFLNRPMVGRDFIRTAIFMPFIVSMAIISFAWSFLLDANIGLVTYWLGKVGFVTEQGWLTDPQLAMPAVMVVGVWKSVGFYMVMYLAGLQSIPTEIYEAATVDGAGPWNRFRHITWPLLANQTMLVSIMAAIATIQVFDQIYVMTRGGPFFSTETLVMLIYRVGFQDLQLGYGSAVSWVLMILVFALSMLQFGYFRKRAVTY
ncbi:MAG TPA: sugar ABC transporter permease [Propionicimonas sp.]|uniref:carbohydrate ABC transporter permease n=1 Tax=Propionicimonas sp. TaxID=1955623 RepID=UPI002F404E4F